MTHFGIRSPLLLLTLAAAGASPSVAAGCDGGPGTTDPQSIPYIIKYRSPSPMSGARAAADDVERMPANVRRVRQMALGAEVVRLSGLDRADIERSANALRRRADVEYVIEDARYELLFQPSDVRYSEQWALKDTPAGISAEPAWDVFTHRGLGALIAIVDTGITSHPDLNGNKVGGYDFITLVESAGDGNARDNNPADNGDGLQDECTARPSTWHGTHVAGIAAAIGNNVEGISGVAPNAAHLPLRSLGRHSGAMSDITDAIVWAAGGNVPGLPANPNVATVINLSIGRRTTACGPLEQAAINYAVSRGVVVVAAAGNNNLQASTSTPGSCANVITVGATDSSGSRAGFSNYGPLVEIYAPGANILSAFNTGQYSPGSPTYSPQSGTSMAAPMVAGVAAMMQATQPRPPAQVSDIIRRTAKLRAGTCSGDCGVGILNAHAAALATKAWPVANFRFWYTKSCPSTQATMINESTDPDGGALSYLWTLNDGRTSSLASPSFSLAPNVTTTFTLKVTDPQGNWTTHSQSFNNASCT